MPHGLAQSFLLREQREPLLMDFPLVTDDKPKEQLHRSLPKVTETGCHDECAHSREAAETRSSTPEMPAVSAFFSLAALAEVAAMENVHRLVVGSLVPQVSGDPVQCHPLHRAGVEKAAWKTVSFSDVICICFTMRCGYIRLGIFM